MSVRMELCRILIRDLVDEQIIELREVDGTRTFPIVIGRPEAMAIDRRLKGQEIPRPQTHDLLATVIAKLGGKLSRVVISDLRGGTFYARLIIMRDHEEIEIDSRPSDAIALGVAEDVPILVAEHVLDRTQVTEEMLTGEFGDQSDDEDEEDDDDAPHGWA